MSGVNDRDRTATESSIRYEEKLSMLGNVIEQLENELLQPLIDRTLSIMMRVGLVETPPQVLQGKEIDYDYIGILAQAQKQLGLNSINTGIGAIQMLQAIKPDVIDNFDADAALREIFDVAGINPNLLRSNATVEEIREARAKAEEARVQQEQALQAAQTAKTLSDTKLDDDNVLTAAAQQGGVQGEAV